MIVMMTSMMLTANTALHLMILINIYMMITSKTAFNLMIDDDGAFPPPLCGWGAWGGMPSGHAAKTGVAPVRPHIHHRGPSFDEGGPLRGMRGIPGVDGGWNPAGRTFITEPFLLMEAGLCDECAAGRAKMGVAPGRPHMHHRGPPFDEGGPLRSMRGRPGVDGWWHPGGRAFITEALLLMKAGLCDECAAGRA